MDSIKDIEQALPPSLKFLVRPGDSVAVMEGPTKLSSTGFFVDGCREAVYSADGSLLVVMLQDSIEVYETASSTRLQRIEGLSAVNLFCLSTTGKFIATHQKPDADGSDKNVKVFRIADGALVFETRQKQVQKDIWPTIQFAGNDRYLLHTTTNTLHVLEYSGTGAAAAYQPSKAAPIEGISGISPSPHASKTLVAVYVPETANGPAVLQLLNFAAFKPVGEKGSGGQPIARRSMFRCQSVRFFWNSLGTSVLALTESSVDKTNKSYYGEQSLHFMGENGTECQVPLGKEGPVYDVSWSPRGEEFVAVHGFMPAKAILFDASARPRFDFGTGPYNTVRWSPLSRFLILAGFGNLPGDVHFFDRKADLKCKPMAQIRCPSVVCQWSPCGRYLLTAITAPRLRVDNGLKIFSYYGEQVAAQSFPVLYDAAWQPAAPGTHPDRPQSPERLKASAASSSSAPAAGGASGAKGAAAGPAAAPAAKGASSYVPPHLRKAGGAAANIPGFSLAYDKEDAGPRKISVAGQNSKTQQQSRSAIPGLEFDEPKKKKGGAKK